VAWYEALGKVEEAVRAIIVSLAALVAAGAALAQDLMSPRAFRDAVIAQVRTLSREAQIEIQDDLSFRIKDGVAVFLNNACTPLGCRDGHIVQSNRLQQR
jgi:hypothetical protein